MTGCEVAGKLSSTHKSTVCSHSETILIILCIVFTFDPHLIYWCYIWYILICFCCAAVYIKVLKVLKLSYLALCWLNDYHVKNMKSLYLHVTLFLNQFISKSYDVWCNRSLYFIHVGSNLQPTMTGLVYSDCMVNTTVSLNQITEDKIWKLTIYVLLFQPILRYFCALQNFYYTVATGSYSRILWIIHL